MTMILLAIALVVQLSGTEETASQKCFDLDENQRVCIEEENGATSAVPTEEFPIINEVEKATYYNI